MIDSNPLQPVHDLMTRAIGEMQKAPAATPLFCELADDAAARVNVRVIEEDQHYPGDRQPDTIKIAGYPDTVSIDLAPYIEAELNMWDEGSHTHAVEGLPADAVIHTSKPRLAFVDGDGNEVSGVRAVAIYQLD